MPFLLKNLEIHSVDSVDRGAGRGVRVLLMKRDTQSEADTMSIENIRKAVASGEITSADIHKALGIIVEKFRRKGEESPQQALGHLTNWRDPRFEKSVHELFSLDVELGKANKPMNTGATGEGEQRPDDSAGDSAELEKLVAEHMRQNPNVKSKSAALRAVMATDTGKKIAARDKARAGIGV